MNRTKTTLALGLLVVGAMIFLALAFSVPSLSAAPAQTQAAAGARLPANLVDAAPTAADCNTGSPPESAAGPS